MFHIKKKNIGEIYVITIIICMTNVFGLYGYTTLGKELYSDDFKYASLFMMSFIFMGISLIKNKKIKYSSKYMPILVSFFLLTIVEMIWSYHCYHQPIIYMMKESLYNFILIFSIFVFFQYAEMISLDFFLSVVVKISIVCSLISICSFALYTFWNINILGKTIEVASFRNGTKRYNIGEIILTSSLIISLTNIFQKKYDIEDLVNLFLGIIQLIVVIKTRSLMLYLSALVVFAYIKGHKIKIYKKIILCTLMIFCVILALLNNDIINQYLDNYISKDPGLMIRSKTIKFYMNQFFSSPILGMGFISQKREIAGWELLHGNDGYMYRSDVGIIGTLNQYGLLGIAWIVAFFYYLKKDISFNLKNKDRIEILINLCIFLIITLPSLSFLTYNLMVYVYMIIAIAVLIGNSERNNEDEVVEKKIN